MKGVKRACEISNINDAVDNKVVSGNDKHYISPR